ncbi:MAG: hypothetical protein QM662_01355 [Gordonia sp. (in: high G+C Gram-positive bacteria)]
MNDYFHLGSYHRPVDTRCDEAQTWFDRGLIWSYGFNHEEAVFCFDQALAADPHCAMAQWGLAYTLGPNYNKPWEFFDPDELRSTAQRTHTAATAAIAHTTDTDTVETALAQALLARYPAATGPSTAEQPIWNQAYADAMGDVYRRFPDDLDVAALYADALMNLTPWELWDITVGEYAPGSRTGEAKAVLEAALALPGGREHPGVLHFYIHLMEMSPTPEAAMPVADLLRGLVPDAGHLEHMPTHLDILCGDYRRAIASNGDAIRADRRFVENRGALNFATLYRAHDLHFRIYAAMFAGRLETALESATALEEEIPESLLRVESPPMADWLEGFLTSRAHVLVRFGRWEEILALPLPDDPALHCVLTATMRYARGIALAVLGRVDEARTEQQRFRDALTTVPNSRMLFNNTCIDILRVAEAMLDGEITYRTGQFEEAFTLLREAVRRDDALPYDEPWGWMQPTRHALGALLLERGRIDDAAAIYAADLGLDSSLPRALQHPDNVWALHGYHECLVRLGRDAEAALIASRLRLATAYADVPITASCFCRVGEQGGEAAHGCCAD